MYPRILQRFDNFLVSCINHYANRRWYKSPLTKRPVANIQEYYRIAEKAKNKKYPLIDEYEQKYGFAINQNWYHELALHTQIVVKKSEICYEHGRLLYSSLRNYIKTNHIKHLTILETGTARGFSALCMAKAMEDSQIEGKIITFDVLPHNVKIYWKCIDDNEGKKTRAELLQNYSDLTGRFIFFHQGNTKTELYKVYLPRINYAFLDSAHDYYYLMAEFINIHDKQKKGDMVFFDDYTPGMFPGVVKAVDEICEKYNYSKEIIHISNERGYVIATKF